MRKKGDMMCSCGKRKGTCNCKGYAYGTKMASPMGYYMGDAEVATPQEEQEMMAMQPGVRVQAATPTPEGPNAMQAAVGGVAMNEALSPVTDFVKDQGSMALSSAKDLIGGQTVGTTAANAAGDAAFDASLDKASTSLADASVDQIIDASASGAAASDAAMEGASKAAGMGSSALSGFGGAAAADLLTKGKVDEKTLLKGGLAMGANMLLPGSGFLVGPAMSMLGLKDGMMEVPPMGYAGGSPTIVGMLADDEGRDKLKELAGGTVVGKALGFKDGTAKMTPEEYQMKFIKERILEPAEAYVEERPMLQAPLLMAAAARDYERGKLPLGKFGGGKLEGGKDRLAYRHKKYGDFEVNPESERVSYKKTFRF